MKKFYDGFRILSIQRSDTRYLMLREIE